jgi:RHS repeat-associated protein
VQSYTYAPFGELLAAQGTRSSALQYTGAQTDLDTGLVYLRARWYDSATGRFTTRDPFPGFAALPQTLHPYVYVNNNPVNLTDPSGEIADIFWDLAIFGVDLLLLFFDSINPTLDECTREQLLSLDRIALGLDLAAIAVPFIPGGSGLAGRLAGRGILILAQGGARASVRAIRVSVQAGVQAGVHASAMTKGSGRGTRGSVGGGQPPSGSTYRKRFYDRYPNAPNDYPIHHRIPQKAKKLGIFPAQVVDSVDNLRAVPKHIHDQINTEWVHFWSDHTRPSPRQVEQFAQHIDQKYGQHFWKP